VWTSSEYVHNKIRLTSLETLQDLNKVQRKASKSSTALSPYKDAISIKSEYVTLKLHLTWHRSGDTVKSVPKQWDVLANLLVDCIQLACESKRDNIIEPALDCLQVICDETTRTYFGEITYLWLRSNDNTRFDQWWVQWIDDSDYKNYC
jgi:hypothetical protein